MGFLRLTRTDRRRLPDGGQPAAGKAGLDYRFSVQDKEVQRVAID
jgi:hypothetical protein